MEATAIINETGDLALCGISDPVPWWSFTKTVLAIAALRLVDQGLLKLDQLLDGQRYTLRHLLRHEAGLPDYGPVASFHADVAAGTEPWPTERLLAILDADRLRYEPGTHWTYSNVGYLKVAELILRTTHMPLKLALEQMVFKPCRLTSTRLVKLPEDLANVQMGDVTSYHPGWVFHGLVVGTIADAALLLQALICGQLLRPQTFAEMLDGRALPKTANAHADAAYGLGLMLWSENPLEHPVGHMGEGPGSKIAVLAEGSQVAAVWAASRSNVKAELHALKLLSVIPSSGHPA